MSNSLPFFALLFNSLVWGLAWWPFKTMHAHGLVAPLATALIYSGLLLLSLIWLRSNWAEFLRTPVLWMLALAAGLTNVSFNTASSAGDVVRVILLFYLMPAWTVLLAWRFLGERPTLHSLLRLGLAFGGMVLVIVPQGATWSSMTNSVGVPEYAAVFGGLCFAATNVILRRSNHTAGFSRVLAMCIGCTTLGLLVGTLGYWSGQWGGIPAPHPLWIACAVGMGILVALGNWSLQFGASRMPTSTTSLIMLSEVPFAAISAWLLGATELTPRMLIGGALIITGALLAVLQQSDKK